MINKGSAIPTLKEMFQMVNEGKEYITNRASLPNPIKNIVNQLDEVDYTKMFRYWRGFTSEDGSFSCGQLVFNSDDNSAPGSWLIKDGTYNSYFMGIPSGRSLYFPFVIFFDDSTVIYENNDNLG